MPFRPFNQLRSYSALVPLTAFAALTAAVATAQAAPVSFRIIAKTGDPVPGFDDRSFAWLSQNPFGGGVPRIGTDGTVSFAGGWDLEYPFPHAIFKHVGVAAELIAAVGDTTDDRVFDGFPGLAPASPAVTPGMHSFDATVGGLQQGGVWIDRGTGLERVFLFSDTPPGTPSGSAWFQWAHTLEGDGHLVVLGRYANGGYSHVNDTGFWRDRGAGLDLVALARTQAPGTPPGTWFGNGTELAMLPFQTWDVEVNGRIGFNAMLMNGDVNGWLNDEGIWLETEDGLELLVREGDAAPGVAADAVFRGLQGFRTFGSSQVPGVARNDLGGAVFGAHVDVPSEVDYPYTSVWTNRYGGLEMLAKGRIPDEGGPGGDRPPGFPPGAHFDDFFANLINDSGEIALAASVVHAGMGDGSGIWIDRGTGLELLVYGGQQVPGLPDGVLFGFPTPWVFDDSGILFFAANLSQGYGFALFAAMPGGEIVLVARRHQSIEVGPGDERLIASIDAGWGVSDQAEIPLRLEFLDGSVAIAKARIESPVNVAEDGPAVRLGLAPPRPNPSDRRVDLAFDLPAASRARLSIFDPQGRVVARLVDGHLEAGAHVVAWDGRGAGGAPAPSGVYWARLESGPRISVRRILRVR